MVKRFWMFLEIELTDLLPRFEKVLEVGNLYRDYENVWEWIEPEDPESAFFLNISRSHDWKKGIYSEPIQILIRKNSNEPINEDEIGKKLFLEFDTTIFFGELVIETKDRVNYSVKVEKTFNQSNL